MITVNFSGYHSKNKGTTMRAIYEPKGKAREYCDLAVNLYKGCGHGCSYCYAPAVLRMQREEFTNHPAVRLGILDALIKDAPKFKGREVQLCFTCDPYQPIDDELQITRDAIKVLKANDITVRILTKGGIRSMRDFDLMEPGRDWYGATLTFSDHNDSIREERYAAAPGERYAAMYAAHHLGFKTWASMEPVKDPEQSLELIMQFHKVVDVFKIGKWNHDKRAKEIDWKGFVLRAVEMLEMYGKEYYLKESLREYLI